MWYGDWSSDVCSSDLRAALPWWSAIGPSIPAGGSSSEAHGGAAEVRDVVGKVHVEGIDERQPEMAGTPSEASTARLGTSRAGGGKKK